MVVNNVFLGNLFSPFKKKTFKISQISLLEVVIICGLFFLIPVYLNEMFLGNKIILAKIFYVNINICLIFPGLASFFFL